VVAENEVLEARRKAMERLFDDLEQGKALGQREQKWLHRLAEVYEVDGDPVADKETQGLLRRRVDVVPADLAVAQAANESGWGRSRFAHKGHNLFGLWTYETDKGLVPKRRGNGKSHLVRKFDNLRESVAEYMHHLNTKGAYKEFRFIRAKLRSNGEPLDGSRLAQGLRRYSELGTEYVRRIRSLIRSNDLDRLSLELRSDSISQRSPS
jgi:Bax protein